MRVLLYLVPAMALIVGIVLLAREMWLIGAPLVVAAIALFVALRQQGKMTGGDGNAR
ncbi:hypothetical protein [Tsuneonella sp. SYSU-LHT278]|uniref:hypothetical protein n=1 Tax=Tsuneonella sediminis TaxID=3416089 RepID=UPI003F7A31EE